MLFLIPVVVAAAGIGVAVKRQVDDLYLADAVEVQRDEFCENIRKQRITIEKKQK